jgi:hypothetical protein
MNRLSVVIVVIFIISLLPAAYAKKSTEVLISAPLRPKYVAKGFKKLYICDFIITGTHDLDKVVNININKEIKETLKTEFKDKSGYEVESEKRKGQ